VRWTGLTCGPGDVGANQPEGRENRGKRNENTAKLEENQKVKDSISTAFRHLHHQAKRFLPQRIT
jgi:hypothetical protein